MSDGKYTGFYITRPGAGEVEPDASTRVLVVEDDRALYGVIASLIEDVGMVPIHASNGQLGPQMFAEHRPALCLVDVLLPRQNGFRVCRAIKARDPDVPVIMMSSVYRNSTEFEADLASCGADDFIVKPFSMEDLRELLLFYTNQGELNLDNLAPSDEAGRNTAAGARILIADPDVSFNGLVAQLLKTLGYVPIQAFAGEQAFQLCSEQPPDLCLLALQLPKVSGRELARQLKTRLDMAGTPILLMCPEERSHVEQERDRNEFQIDGALTRPFAANHLAEQLERHLSAAPPEGVRSRWRDARAQDERLDPRGELSVSTFAALLHTIFALKLSGHLRLEHQGLRRDLYFLDGSPVSARSNSMSESLGNHLVEAGLIAPDALTKLAASCPPNTPLGQVLVHRGYITANQLYDALLDQTRDRFLAGFDMRGRYAFSPGDAFRDRTSIFELNPIALIREYVDRSCAVNDLADELQNFVDRYIIPTGRFEALAAFFPVEEREVKLLELFDGVHSLGEIFRHRVLDVSATLRLIWALYLSGMITFVHEPISPPITLSIQALHNLHAVSPPHSSPSRPARRKAAAALRQEIMAAWIMLEQGSIYQVLGIAPEVDTQTFLAACDHTLERFDPTRLVNLSSELRNQANAIFTSVRAWRHKYADPGERQRYNRILKQDSGAFGLSEGVVAYNEARQAISRQDWPLAVQRLQRAAARSPDDADVLSDLAWATFHLPNPEEARDAECIAQLERALALNPRHITAMMRLARILYEVGDIAGAARRLGRVLELDPDHDDARQLINIVRPGASEQVNDQRSLWDRLFGD